MSNIVVPLPRKEIIKFYLENEIDGFIMGIDGFSENFNNYVKINEIDDYIKIIKEKKKSIYISLNKPIFNKELNRLKELLFILNKIDIDGVIFDDISVLNIINDNNLNINPIWYGVHKGTNSKTINFLSKRGVKSSFLSNEITIDEIIDIMNNVNIRVIVTLFGYINMATSSRSLITNYFKYTKKEKNSDKYFIKEKRSEELYPVVEKENTNFFTSKILNGITYFPKVIDNKNLNFVFLDDYMINEKNFYNVMEAFIALTKAPTDTEFVHKLSMVIDSNVNNTDILFLNKKTIFKVKNNE